MLTYYKEGMNCLREGRVEKSKKRIKEIEGK
jgi:hypothetical protein